MDEYTICSLCGACCHARRPKADDGIENACASDIVIACDDCDAVQAVYDAREYRLALEEE